MILIMSILALDKHRNRTGALAKLSPANPARIVASNPGPSAVGGVIGTQIFNSTASSATNVLTHTINVGGITAGIVTGVQFLGDSYQCINGSMPAKELGRRIVRNATGMKTNITQVHIQNNMHFICFSFAYIVTDLKNKKQKTKVNGTAVIGGAGGSAVGGAIGTLVFPGTGTVVGSVIGGICGSVSFGKLVNDKFEDWWRGYRVVYVEDSREILEHSMAYFHFDANSLNDPSLINMEIAHERYREFAKIYHPDKGGSKEEWLALTNNFAVVTDAIRKRDKKLPKNNQSMEILRLKKEMEHQRIQIMQEKQAMQQEIQQLRQTIQLFKKNNRDNYGGVNANLAEVAL